MIKKIAIIGLSNFGYWLARTIFDFGLETIVIDVLKEKVQAMKPFSTQAIIGDATKKEVLTGLGLQEMDAVAVSLGDNISASSLVTLYLHEIGVKRILVKAVDEDHAKILSKIGATDIILPEKDTAMKTAKALAVPNIIDYIPITEGYEIAEIAPPDSFIGKRLYELALPQKFDIQVIAIKELVPERFTIIPKADFVVKDSDILVIIGKSESIRKIRQR